MRLLSVKFFVTLQLSIGLLSVNFNTDINDQEVYYSNSGYAEFTSSVPLHTFSGESDNLTGMIDFRDNIVDFFLDLNTLRTGIDRRDRDMFRTLNVEEHPFAEFNGSLETEFDEDSTEEQDVVVSGEFTINGVTREITIEGSMQQQDDGLRVNAEWIILLEDYDIEAPGILFYRVDEEQKIRINIFLEPYDREVLLNAN